MSEIPCLPLKTVTDGPLFGRAPGTLASLQNMSLTVDGYAEARGGFEKPKLVGGTASDGITSGGYCAVQELSTSYGWIRTFDSAAAAGIRYSANFQLHPGGFRPFPTVVATDAIYFGMDHQFSRIALFLSRALNSATFVVAYEYWNGAAYTAFAATPETINFAAAYVLQYGSWRLPSDWVPSVTGDGGGSVNGNVYKYWMRIRIVSVTGLVTIPLVQTSFMFGAGMREIYFSSADPLVGSSTGTFERHGLNGTTVEWFPIATIAAMNAAPTRLAAYRGRVVSVNPKENKRWDGFSFADLGVTSTAITGVATPAALAAGMGAGVWRYYYAWGNGPCQNILTYADRQDAQALYGVGRVSAVAASVGGFDVTTTAGVNERVQLELTTTPPAGVSAVYIYRTDDLAAVAAGKRANMPAYLINSFRILEYNTGPLGFEQAWGGAGNFYFDTQVDQAFPRQEATTYDVAPPRSKYAIMHQNWLLLGDDDQWYISDPFQIDRFSTKSTTGFIRLNGANGGRNMGGISFGDQVMLFTDNQTWGATNFDLDIYQLFPIALYVGCVAPDAAATGEGRAIWPGHDGFYQWLGGRDAPKKISAEFDQTFQKMSYETHGGSRATIVDRKYIFRPAAPDGSSSGSLAYVYDFDTETWGTLNPATFASRIYPLATVHAPLGNSDAGVLHSIWGKVDYSTGANEYSLFLGNLTTQDNGTNYTCSAQMHYPLPPSKLFKPRRVLAYYSAADGWGTPTMSFAGASLIGSDPGSLNAGTPDVGADYSLLGGTFSGVSSGTSDLKVTFTVASAAGGTPLAQRFYGAVLEGEPAGVRMGAV